MKYLYPLWTKYSFLTIFLLGFVVFSNVLFNQFVWLDYPYLINNPAAHNLNLIDLFTGSSLTAQGYYRPIAAVYLSTIHSLFDGNAFFYHFFQVILRAFNAYLIFQLFAKLLKKPLALFLALVYLVHPLNQSQVAFISSVADILFISFGVGALLIAMREKQTWKTIGLTYLLLLGSILSKESGFIFFIAILAYQCIFQRKYILKYIVFGVAAELMYLVLRASFQELAQPELLLYPMARLSLLERFINIPQIYYFYIEKFFYPRQIGGLHLWSHTEMTFTTFYLPLLVDLGFLSLLTASGVMIYKKAKHLFNAFLFFLTIYISGQVLYLQIFPLDYTVADRWFALAMIGLLGIFGTFLSMYTYNKKQLQMAGILALFILGFLSYRTVDRNTYWKDDIALFEKFERNEDNFVVQNWLANALFTKKDYNGALSHINQSISMFPYDNNLMLKALTQEKLSQKKESLATMQAAINADNFAPGAHDPQTYSQFIQFLIRNNQHDAAKQVAAMAVTDYPDDAYFLSMYATESYISGEKDTAQEVINRAYDVAPEEPNVVKLFDIISNNRPL